MVLATWKTNMSLLNARIVRIFFSLAVNRIRNSFGSLLFCCRLCNSELDVATAVFRSHFHTAFYSFRSSSPRRTNRRNRLSSIVWILCVENNKVSCVPFMYTLTVLLSYGLNYLLPQCNSCLSPGSPSSFRWQSPSWTAKKRIVFRKL